MTAVASYADFAAAAPMVPPALIDLGRALGAAFGDDALLELVKIRASQINGCAYCLQLHLTVARRLAVPPAKLDLVAVWRDAGLFDARERAALAWTEAATALAGRPVREEVRREIEAVFSEKEIAQLAATVALINAWNRIAGPLGFAPPTDGR